MRIFNVRLGFATNSSSVHSVIFAPKGLKDKDVYGQQFGWGEFICSTPDAKTRYCVQQLRQALREVLDEDGISYVMRSMFPDLFSYACGNDPFISDDEISAGYVDHQSQWVFPRDDEGRYNLNFAKAFCDAVIRGDLAIVGGNDNSFAGDEEYEGYVAKHYTMEEFEKEKRTDWRQYGTVGELPIFEDDYHAARNGDIIARSDVSGRYWVLFNKKTGAKIRLSTEDLTEKDPIANHFPRIGIELVDLKLTSKCTVGCQNCYQNSTPEGEHAELKDIENIIWQLRRHGVFEVALGGGDPVEHPEFIKILEYCKLQNVVPSFSSAHLKWAAKPKVVEAVRECVGAFALSTQDPKQVVKVRNVWDRLWSDHYDSPKAYIHYVMGISPLENLKKMLTACKKHNVSIVLLGYKACGRAQETPPYDYSDWLEVAKECYGEGSWYTIAIDTALAREEKQKAANEFYANRKSNCYVVGKDGEDWEHPRHIAFMPDISPVLYDVTEGIYSCYIDAVEKKYGPSSYEVDKLKEYKNKIPILDLNYNEFDY